LGDGGRRIMVPVESQYHKEKRNKKNLDRFKKIQLFRDGDIAESLRFLSSIF
jgi:hypothetical protein